MTKQTQQLVLMLVIGVLIGISGYMVMKSNSASTNASVSTTDSGATTSLETLVKGTNSGETLTSGPQLPATASIPQNTRIGITVPDQKAGSEVRVSNLETSDATNWVVVYDNRGNAPSWIMGAKRIRKGDNSAVVELLRPTTSGEKYYVAILQDDGNDTFDRRTDLPSLSPEKITIVYFNSLP